MQEREAIDHYLANEERRAEDELRTLVAEVGLRSARRRLLPVNGTVASTVLECGREEEVDVVVVGTSQRRGMERLMVGNVAEDLLKHADRDVLVMPWRERADASTGK